MYTFADKIVLFTKGEELPTESEWNSSCYRQFTIYKLLCT